MCTQISLDFWQVRTSDGNESKRHIENRVGLRLKGKPSCTVSLISDRVNGMIERPHASETDHEAKCINKANCSVAGDGLSL